YGTSSAPRIWPPVERCTQRTASETLRRDWRASALAWGSRDTGRSPWGVGRSPRGTGRSPQGWTPRSPIPGPATVGWAAARTGRPASRRTVRRRREADIVAILTNGAGLSYGLHTRDCMCGQGPWLDWHGR